MRAGEEERKIIFILSSFYFEGGVCFHYDYAGFGLTCSVCFIIANQCTVCMCNVASMNVLFRRESVLLA